MIFLELFMTFFVIGMFTIGGGMVIISLIQTQVVNVHGWIDDSTFTDIVAISQMTPGPVGINCATYTGYQALANSGAGELLCILGSFTATTATVLPSFIIVLILCRLYTRFSQNQIFGTLMAGLRPTVAGLIGAAAIMFVTPENFPDWKSWLIFAAALAASLIGKLNPVIAIIGGGVAGYILYGLV